MSAPERGDTLDLEDADGHPVRTIHVLAIDPEVRIWTVRDARTGELTLLTFDADANWHELTCEITDAN